MSETGEGDLFSREDLAETLSDVARYRMPFGKYGPERCPPDGVPLYDLPLDYLLWFHTKGFPKGRLGELMKFVYHVKADGSEEIFGPMREKAGGRHPLKKPRKREFDIE